ncbi:unnamed protein product [Sphagnum balticum]
MSKDHGVMNENGEIDSNENTNAKDDGNDVVTPWSVTSSSAAGVDYDKLLGELAGTLVPNENVQSGSAVRNCKNHLWNASHG